ncbi:hypothetical protein ACFSWE_16580 [Leucobacter albus]|uniref:ANTAR domain-containing protein n=1 Tax=Leucobacter albus TaxID=272210 RepID=A0ABW3TSY1_9MICO
MDLELKTVIELLAKIARSEGDEAVAEHVLAVVSDLDSLSQRVILGAVADGLGVPLV